MATVVKKSAMIAGGVGLLVFGAGTFLYETLTDSTGAYIDPSDHTLVARGKKIYAKTVPLATAPSWRGNPIGGFVKRMDVCPPRRTMKPGIPGIIQTPF